MPGGQMHVSAFDPTKKMDWLNADIVGFMYMTVAVFIALFVVTAGIYALATSLSSGKSMILIVVVSMTIAFVLVFCLRKNWMVIGESRKFRYICRWL